MINENTEVRDEQRIITPAVSTINQTIEQITQNWRQISFPGFDRFPLQTKFKNPTSTHSSITPQVNLDILELCIPYSFFFTSLFIERRLCLHRTQ